MYQPPHFIEERLEVQHQLIRAHPFGLLISVGADGPEANGIPFLLDATYARHGRLLAHVARANGQWRELHGQRVLAVFQGPQAYISPSLYETKRETGKVVPTWNYAMVQVKGTALVHEDADWLRAQVTALTASHENTRTTPWAVSDAPESYIRSQLKGIVGIEIPIESIAGKWKMSQNRPESDRIGVAEGVGEAQMSALVREYGKL
ncbi:FMN-binding negative transcriptional regulator [Aestuariivirga litoralis]|uniref:FMN-binding negative transcriptional regulator n=1 Tax=Aestuariivirga litoralis TaxID=2650924 RepID=UPI0018C65E59|nr:FMN-binding negative transcriptional regulator [Aestuariivirga litoralis]MBG1232841.1 FMN-binding negative transcriptional regulator [Aestuariivirga litoralis]